MNIHLKSSIIIIVTLLIGVLLGVIISGPFIHSRFEDRLARMKTAHGFADRLAHIIEPDSTQRKAVEEILSQHSQMIHAIMDRSRDQIAAVTDSMLADLDTVLTDEQKKRLDEHFRSLREGIPHHDKPHFRRGRYPGRDKGEPEADSP